MQVMVLSINAIIAVDQTRYRKPKIDNYVENVMQKYSINDYKKKRNE